MNSNCSIIKKENFAASKFFCKIWNEFPKSGGNAIKILKMQEIYYIDFYVFFSDWENGGRPFSLLFLSLLLTTVIAVMN